MTIGEKVLAARRALGREWTQEKLTKELHAVGFKVSRSWVASLETDRVKNLEPDEITALAKALRKPESYFTEDIFGASFVREEPRPLRDSTDYRFLEIPFLGVVRADRFSFSFDLPPENFTTLAIKGSAGDRYAVLRISGDCMAPTIDEGDEVLIRKVDVVLDGSIAIVCFDGECTLKRVYKKKDGVELRADNKEYKPRLIASSKLQVLAEVVKIMKDPRRKP